MGFCTNAGLIPVEQPILCSVCPFAFEDAKWLQPLNSTEKAQSSSEVSLVSVLPPKRCYVHSGHTPVSEEQ